MTVSPYMGYDSLAPFLERRNKGVFILCRTSNPGASDIQSLNCPEPLYQIVAKKAMEYNINKNIGFVVGATQGSDLKAVPSNSWGGCPNPHTGDRASRRRP